MKGKHRPRTVIRKRPAESSGVAAGIVAFLAAMGVDRPTAAWIALGISLVPAIVSPIVDWYRKRP